jgi:hypothetical protein
MTRACCGLTNGLPRLGLALLALVALGTVVAGPAFDPHFAERMPLHGHVYLDGVPHAHHHSFDPLPPEDRGEAPPRVLSQDVVVVPSTDAATSVPVIVPAAPSPVATESSAGLTLTALPALPVLAPDDPFLGVPTQPPRP